MFSYIYSCWNYIKLYRHTSKFYQLHNTKNITNTDINIFISKIIPIISNCGCVCIKFCQWLTPILDFLYNESDDNPEWLQLLETFYENCSIHSLNYTKKIYKQEFHKDILDTYEILEIIGSGSIGQVYKIKHIKSDEIFAMKVLHPHVAQELWLFKWIVYIIYSIPYLQKKINRILPINFIEFMKLFETQLNMIQEANNLSLMKYNNRNDSEYIKIPHLIKCSPSILLMSYEPATSLDDTDISDYEKLKLFILMYLYCRYNFEYKNFNHADLHKGNWKITKDKKIQIYDFGYCYTIHNMKVVNLLTQAILDTHDDSTDDNIQLMVTLICEIFNNHSKDFQSHIIEYFNKLDKRVIADPKVLLKAVCSMSLYINKLIDPYIIQAIITQIQNNKYLTRYNINNKLEQWSGNQVYYRRDYINYYNICKTYDIFSELQDRFKEIFSNSDIVVNNIFDVIENKDIFTDEIKSLLKFD